MADPYTTFRLAGPINLDLRSGTGSVTIVARDDLTEATVRLTGADARSDVAARSTVELQGPTLVVNTPRQGGLTPLLTGWRGNRDRVDIEVVVPTGTATKISTMSADITIKGRIGGADISTGSADVNIDTIDGDLRLRYGSAQSRVYTVTGSVTIRSGSGDAVFGEVGGSLQAGFGSGDLQVGVARGAVKSRAGSGDARLGEVHGDVDVAAGSGTVAIGLPSGVSARLEVTTGSGRVNSELPIERTESRSGKAIVVKARTGSGDVRLFRAGTAA